MPTGGIYYWVSFDCNPNEVAQPIKTNVSKVEQIFKHKANVIDPYGEKVEQLKSQLTTSKNPVPKVTLKKKLLLVFIRYIKITL